MKYVLAIDQSTQGTKALLVDEQGEIVSRAYKPHRQIVDERGYISHDLDEIWQNVVAVSKECVAGREGEVVSVGISNQRETSCIWNENGPLASAVVWQCARAQKIVDSLQGYADTVREKTGLPLSPYFPAAKYAWLLKNTQLSGKLHLGTVDAYLIWKMTGNFYTDYSNAARTQLFNIHSLRWDVELCDLFGVKTEYLPKVMDSDADYGSTTIDGVLPQPVPVRAVLGDSHAALYAQGCTQAGQCKVTYGTGSSVMMNVGKDPAVSRHGLSSSLAWKIGGEVNYVLEGNINYSCAVITWLKDDLGLISDAKEVGKLAAAANSQDECILIPAFSGLSAPYWKPNAKAALLNMTRTTGRNEICRAAEESIAFQIADILDCLRADTGCPIAELRADGGATGDAFLMQLQANVSRAEVIVAQYAELSALGVARLAWKSFGVQLPGSQEPKRYFSVTDCGKRAARREVWTKAVRSSIAASK